MTLLISNDALELALPNILWHSTMVDLIVCTASNPCKLLEYTLRHAETLVSNFKYLGADTTKFTLDYQSVMVNRMVEVLKSSGMDWVLNADDDEFYIGPLRQVLESATAADVMYTNGFCFYETCYDSFDRNPVRRMTYRDPDTVDYGYRKAIHRAADFVSTTNGNHFVALSKSNAQIAKSPNLLIYHYTFRRKTQVTSYPAISAETVAEKNLVVDTTLPQLFDKIGIFV
jgi:hypothetical protein